MARKGILTPEISTDAKREPRGKPRGAVGALQSSLSKLQENAVQDIDAALIDDAGLEDRLGFDYEAQKRLKQSLETYGQQVPVLLRPHSKTPGRYEIVFGRRRLHALKDLGLPVKAMVRQLDDHALVMAQGQENTARQDLSFIEKASFAAQLQSADYERQTIADALSIDLPMVSRMLKVGTAFDLDFLRAIGSAPGIGRDRWMMLVKALSEPGGRSRAQAFMRRPEFDMLGSDDRFEAVLSKAMQAPTKDKPPAPAKPRTLRSGDGTALGDIRSTHRAVTLNIKTAEFGSWLERHAEDLLQDLHARWTNERAEEAE
jgi:ParB family chromosome partitioning protein